MGFITERERTILQYLREGSTVKEIARRLRVSDTSVSRSISNIKTKTGQLAEDVEFLSTLGLLQIRSGKVEFLTRNRDPKALAALARHNKS